MIYSGLDLSEACADGYIMAVYKSGAELGKWNGSDIPWKEKYREDELLELHIFNNEKEYRAVRSVRAENGFIYSVISEESMKKDYGKRELETKHIDCDMLLFGEEFIGADKGVYIVKESGREKKIYLDYTKEDFEKGIYLKVRDYYDFDENALMYLSGYRLYGISVKKEKENNDSE